MKSSLSFSILTNYVVVDISVVGHVSHVHASVHCGVELSQIVRQQCHYCHLQHALMSNPKCTVMSCLDCHSDDNCK